MAHERAGNWSLATRCAQNAVAGGAGDQRSDKNCPNILLIYTDDMAWGDLTLNNPSKLVPTPNIDRLVSKGINFRDGHTCTARCAPARYCIMTGRNAWRRGSYAHAPMALEVGRKVMPHMFKRNNYRTYLVGKEQPFSGTTAVAERGIVPGKLFISTSIFQLYQIKKKPSSETFYDKC